MLEVEVKLKIDKEKAEPKLIEQGFHKGTSVYEHDIYFNGRSLDLKAADKALRIREHKDLDTGIVKHVLNFKGPKTDEVTMTREETQFTVPSYEAGATVLNGLGFFPAGEVEKTRIHYKKDDITCCLDSVTDLGDFLEIEIMAEENEYGKAVGQIEEVLARMGYELKDTIRESYLGMIQKTEERF